MEKNYRGAPQEIIWGVIINRKAKMLQIIKHEKERKKSIRGLNGFSRKDKHSLDLIVKTIIEQNQ